ncbi:MAG TPA: hypothetical protein VF234_04545 [Limnochordia bacterium]
MRRGTSIVLSIVVVAALGGSIAYQLIPKDSTSRETFGQALARFRGEMRRAANLPRHASAPIPAFGVYRYRTNGSESIDTTAFSTAHNYDGVSTIILTPTRCGVMEHWQPLTERWSEGNLCVGADSTHVIWVRDFHEFFERSKEVSYDCSGGEAPYSMQLRAGDRWQTRCESDQGTIISRVRVIGIEKVPVAGEPIEAVHLRAGATLSGDPDGSDLRDSWIRRSDGLLLRRVDHSKAHVDVSGGGDFEEEYDLRLLSTQPQR